MTPPIALAGFAGAAIANANPMETSFQAWKFAKGLYLIPAFMVFNPEIIEGGSIQIVLWTGFTAILCLVAFASALEGYLFAHMDIISRIVIVPATIGVFWPDLRAEIAGTIVLLVVLGLNWWKGKKNGPTPAVATS